MTFREFHHYSRSVEFYDEIEWNRQSQMMSLHANMNAPKGKNYKPQQFNPYAIKAKKGDVAKSKDQVISMKERILARQKAAQNKQGKNE